MSNKKITILIVLGALILGIKTNTLAQSSARIMGVVKEAQTGEVLWGANVIVLGTSLGGSSDMNGKFTIQSVPIGSYTLRVTYIGYKEQEIQIDIKSNKTIEVNLDMEPEAVKGETVIVTAQRKGQIAAINQQLNSNTITNVVSSDKIQELPEANAAEAVGRLPGISLLREGGEGNKVVIRGLAPKYNKIQIEGVDMAGTDPQDRSTDLSMISPYMLDGIEVTKSALASQEADQLGGTVNFLLRGAPSGEPSFKLFSEGGYNGLRREAKDYQFGGLGSFRLFNDLIGVSINAEIERKNRSSNTVSAGYAYSKTNNFTVVNSLNIQDITRSLDRYNGSVVLDYKTPGTKMFLNSIISKIDRLNIDRSERTSSVNGSAGRTQYLTNSEANTTILMNQFRLEQNIENFKVNAGLSYSYSKTEVPEELGYGGLEAGVNPNPVPPTTLPSHIPDFMKKDVSTIDLSDFSDSNSKTKEDELGTFLDLHWEYRISDQLNLKIQTGGKYKHKSRLYDYNTIFLDLATDPSSIVNQAIVQKWPWMKSYSQISSFSYEPFIDNNYNPGDFMRGQYELERVPSLDMGTELLHYLIDYLGVEWGGTSRAPQRFVPNFHTSKISDYNGTEDYWASYIMPTLSIGNQITFIPGFRYEHNKTIYTGVRGNGNGDAPAYRYRYHNETVTRENEFFLPMIHLKYKPLEWFDVRLSYTQTLSRPDYNEFLPSWNIYGPPVGIEYSNPNLKPAKSANYDLYFSFYGNKIGLFTLGLFAKRIDDLIFADSKTILSEAMAIDEFGLSEDELSKNGEQKLTPASFVGRPIDYYLNNPNKVDVRGIEIEWQSNLWYLPGFFKNIVFGINYTYTFSETKYPRTVPIDSTIQSPFGPRKIVVGNADSSYTAPLLFQPDNIINITLGYDYKGFSIRGSMQFKSKIFSQNDWQPQLRGYTNGFTIFDLALVQKLPVEGLSVYLNLNNISRSIETDTNQGTGYDSNLEYYSLTGSLGARYEF